MTALVLPGLRDLSTSVSVLGHGKKVLLFESCFLDILCLSSFAVKGGNGIQSAVISNNYIHNLYIAPKFKYY